uniref:Uncharacterized protein n=1 Tax=Candidatus Kentrum sp. FW TaxID=2126338 RepID=A0A450RUD6_9GAMM|nr:MAG: hypothetical protein BECKFW1821A_GA0114235_100260 [Candidatus Kentron sp. FW]
MNCPMRFGWENRDEIVTVNQHELFHYPGYRLAHMAVNLQMQRYNGMTGCYE